MPGETMNLNDELELAAISAPGPTVPEYTALAFLQAIHDSPALRHHFGAILGLDDLPGIDAVKFAAGNTAVVEIVGRFTSLLRAYADAIDTTVARDHSRS